MKKLLAFTSLAILTAGVAQASTGNDHYGPGMYEQHDQIEVLFDKLDLDNDGIVLNNEYNAMQSLMTEKITVEFSAMDLDKDGKITRAEAGEYATLSVSERNAYVATTKTTTTTAHKHPIKHDRRVMKTERHHHNHDYKHNTGMETTGMNGAYKLNN